MNIKRIKKNYETGLWSEQMLRNGVESGFLSPEDYYYVTGKMYEVKESKS